MGPLSRGLVGCVPGWCCDLRFGRSVVPCDVLPHGRRTTSARLVTWYGPLCFPHAVAACFRFPASCARLEALVRGSRLGRSCRIFLTFSARVGNFTMQKWSNICLARCGQISPSLSVSRSNLPAGTAALQEQGRCHSRGRCPDRVKGKRLDSKIGPSFHLDGGAVVVTRAAPAWMGRQQLRSASEPS